MSSFFIFIIFQKKKRLKDRVLKYFDYLWCRQRALDEISILSDLPVALRMEVAAFVNRDLFRNTKTFQDCDPLFMRHLIAALYPVVFFVFFFLLFFFDAFFLLLDLVLQGQLFWPVCFQFKDFRACSNTSMHFF